MDHVLRPLIEEEGPLPFPRFMELALYHGEHGYYSNPACTCGTLQTYARHRAGDDPLDAPGQRDLTTH
ncbi:MAG: SAM-dependent methyltransferase, partial [Verrucomicrobiota bacterium]|nr:SAM-dependent methyltransferase [Verrucomicrobiota bacterium]